MITYTDTISVEDYLMLREVVGWTGFVKEQAEEGLKHSSYLLVAKDGERTVGMIRVVSDNGYVRFLCDVIVHPEYQGQGIGKVLVSSALDSIKNELKEGYYVQISLLAAKGKEAFYEKFGFISRPDEVLGAGMMLRISK